MAEGVDERGWLRVDIGEKTCVVDRGAKIVDLDQGIFVLELKRIVYIEKAINTSAK